MAWFNDRVSSMKVRTKGSFRCNLYLTSNSDSEEMYSFTRTGKYNQGHFNNLSKLTRLKIEGHNYRVILYSGSNYSGLRCSFTAKDGLVNLKNIHGGYFNDNVRSIWTFKVEDVPRYVILHERDPIGSGYYRRYQTRGKHNNLHQGDGISWIEIGSNYGSSGKGSGVRLWSNNNYTGETDWLAPGVYNLTNLWGGKWNDRVKSMEIY
jgi:hypothetical protein